MDERITNSENENLPSRVREIQEPDHQLPPANNKRKRHKKSSAAVAAAAARNAVEHVKSTSRRDVDGTSGLNNTGPSVNYVEDRVQP